MCDSRHGHLQGASLTGFDDEGDRLLGEHGAGAHVAHVAGVVIAAILHQGVGEVQVPVQALGHTFVQLDVMQLWRDRQDGWGRGKTEEDYWGIKCGCL